MAPIRWNGPAVEVLQMVYLHLFHGLSEYSILLAAGVDLNSF